MYQIGFIEVLRQTNVVGGLKMMQRSMKLLDEECPRPNSPNLWWIAQAMLDGYINNALRPIRCWFGFPSSTYTGKSRKRTSA